MRGQAQLDALVENTVPLRRQGRPAEIAAAAAFLAGPAASYTGHNLWWTAVVVLIGEGPRPEREAEQLP